MSMYIEEYDPYRVKIKSWYDVGKVVLDNRESGRRSDDINKSKLSPEEKKQKEETQKFVRDREVYWQ